MSHSDDRDFLLGHPVDKGVGVNRKHEPSRARLTAGPGLGQLGDLLNRVIQLGNEPDRGLLAALPVPI
jgi:hypothetical protein